MFSCLCLCICVFLCIRRHMICALLSGVLFFKQQTAYGLRISDWSSDVCSSDLARHGVGQHAEPVGQEAVQHQRVGFLAGVGSRAACGWFQVKLLCDFVADETIMAAPAARAVPVLRAFAPGPVAPQGDIRWPMPPSRRCREAPPETPRRKRTHLNTSPKY